MLPIGGADMPVVISLLNAFTGLSAAAAGLALDNVALIVGGMLVGASGSILTMLMAEAMNRSIPNIIAGGFGGVTITPGASGDGEQRPVRSTGAADVAIQLAYASKVVVAPGYGMAVAQAQHTVRELADELERGVRVDYAIHPVAGRMPGHMNVLLAEADVPYDHLKEMDEINPEFPQTDVALVIGANDVTNPPRASEESSPIYGMPILDVDKAAQVIVLKRSMNTGFAGIDNPLFYNENTALLFGDAKESVAAVLAEVKDLWAGVPWQRVHGTSHASCACRRPRRSRARGYGHVPRAAFVPTAARSTHTGTSRSRSRADRSRPSRRSWRGCSRRWRSTDTSVCSRSAPATAGKPCCWRASSPTW